MGTDSVRRASLSHALYRLRLGVGVFFLAVGWALWFGPSSSTAIGLLLAPVSAATSAADNQDGAIVYEILRWSGLLFTVVGVWFLVNAKFPTVRRPKMHSHPSGSLTDRRRYARLLVLNRPARWDSFLWVYTLYLGLALLTGDLGELLSDWLTPSRPAEYPWATDPDLGYALGQLYSSAAAGPTEEVLFAAAIPLLALTLFKNKGLALGFALAISVPLRAAFHLYYGIPYNLALAFWAAGAVLLWWKTGQLLALMAAHIGHNLIATLWGFEGIFPIWLTITALIVLLFVPGVAAWALLLRRWRLFRDMLIHGWMSPPAAIGAPLDPTGRHDVGHPR